MVNEGTTFSKELKRGTLEMMLLQMLSERQMYGYELATTLEEQGGSLFRIKEGTLYPILYRLENAGYIESRWETLERGVPRKYYRLTAAGVVYLEARIAEWKEFFKAVNQLIGHSPTD